MNTVTTTRAKREFQDLFYEQLYAYEVDGEEPGTLFITGGTGYNTDKLAALLGEVDNAVLSGSGSVFKSPDETYITLQDVKVDYETSKGFYTSVTADIKIETPKFKSVIGDCSPVVHAGLYDHCRR